MTAEPVFTTSSMLQLFISSFQTSASERDDTITSLTLLSAPDITIFRLLPLILSHLQHLGDTIVAAERRTVFNDVIHALHARISARRSLKLRFLLLIQHPTFASYWTFQPVYRSHPYSFARYGLTQFVADVRDLEEDVSATALLNNSTALVAFANDSLFSPGGGVRLRSIMQHDTVVRAAFYGVDLVDAVVQHADVADREHAVSVGQALLSLGVVHAIEADPPVFVDSGTTVYQCRRAVLRYDRDVKIRDVEEAEGTRVRRVHLRVSMDMIDLQSLDFWGKGVYVKHVDNGFQYDYRAVVHPIHIVADSAAGGRVDVIEDVSGDGEEEVEVEVQDGGGETECVDLKHGDAACDLAEEATIVGSIVVRKVFSSMAHPMIVELRKLVEDGNLREDDEHIVLEPGVLVKAGDNLMLDAGVQLMFRLFNSIWEASTLFSTSYDGVVPFCIAYEVFPTSGNQGIMEALKGLTSLKEFDWKAWCEEFEGDAGRVNDMVRSAAGAYVGTYIIGGRDRHFENVLVKDRKHLLHIDFSYILGRKPTVDGPSISIAPEMEKAFRKLNVWDTFVDMCVDSFLLLRKNAKSLVGIATLLFTKAGFNEGDLQKFLEGSHSFHVHCEEKEAADRIRIQIVKSSKDVLNWFKGVMQDTVVPIWYDMIKKGFPPAKLIVSFMDAHEESGATIVAGTDDVEIDEDEIVEVM